MTTKYERRKIKEGYTYIIGCDEVGRGSLAGPVVAAAVVMRPEFLNHKSSILNLRAIKDSKLLTASKRDELTVIIKQYFLWSIAEVSPTVIDKINIHNASLLAMKKAVKTLLHRCEGFKSCKAIALVVIDGKFILPSLDNHQEAVVDGDNKILSIAAASIIAKVFRDNLMQKLGKKYPEYDFAEHKGYGTLSHRTAIIKNGLSPIHRKSFCRNFN